MWEKNICENVFSYFNSKFVGNFTTWFQICIRIQNTDPGPAAQTDPDPFRIRNPTLNIEFFFSPFSCGAFLHFWI
jgi:hypothetical protein